MNRRAFLLSPLVLAAAGSKPNIVVVIARGWRGVATPWNGDRDITGTKLEAFASEAIVFPRAYAAYPHPAQARKAILTGRFPHAAGDAPSLDSILREAGYRVGQQVGASTDFLTGAAPYFWTMTLEPRFGTPRSGTFRVRDNVPEDRATKVQDDLRLRYGTYSQIDGQLGAVLSAIDRSNAIVVFTSDAGEQVGSHGLSEDDSFYEESVRVPLAISFPGVRPGASDLLASHVDLMPTLLGLLGEPPVASVQGRDLSYLLTAGRGDRPESVFAEGRIGQRDEWRMLVLGMDKIVVDAAGEITHLFNLATDPYEMNNLAKEPSVQLKRAGLLATIRAERSRVSDFRRR